MIQVPALARYDKQDTPEKYRARVIDHMVNVAIKNNLTPKQACGYPVGSVEHDLWMRVYREKSGV